MFAGTIGNATAITAAAAPGTYYVRVFAVNACGMSAASSNEIVIAVP